MSGEKEFFDDSYCFESGKNVMIQEGNDVTVFSTGSILSEVMTAAEMLKELGIEAKIINVHTLKPLDTDHIIAECKKQSHIVTVEEHNVVGGLGTAIADAAVESGLPINLKKIGLNDRFAQGFGSKASVLRDNQLDASGIYEKIRIFMAK